MKYQDKNASIGEVVVELPKATEVFKKFGIDFCCGGHRKLDAVIEEQKVDRVALYEQLDQLYQERISGYEGKGNRFDEMSPEELTVYIEDSHHVYMRKVLPEILNYLNTLLRVHGKKHGELFDLYRVYGVLKTDLEQHLLKEESMLFPDFNDEDNNKQEIVRLTKTIMEEHEAAGELLQQMRVITRNYQLPADACQTFERTYQLLEEMEDDLHQHIHLENNILLKAYRPR